MKKDQAGFRVQKGVLENFLESEADFQGIDLVYAHSLKDSSMLNPEDWNQWGKTLSDLSRKKAGIVLVHGTDTLAYSAAALSIYFVKPKAALVLTGAMLPLSDPSSDGGDNLRAATHAAAVLPPGVYVVFAGKLFSAWDVVKIDSQGQDAFYSPHFGPLAHWQKKTGWGKMHLLPPICLDLTRTVKGNVFFASPDSLLNYFFLPGGENVLTHLLINQKCSAVLLQSFGSGNFPLPESLQEAIKKAHQQGALIVNSSQNLKGTADNCYQAAAGQKENGIISAGSVPIAVLYALLLAVLPLEGETPSADLKVRFEQMLSPLKELFSQVNLNQ